MSYQGPLEVRIEMDWSDEGIARFRNAMGPTVPIPKYKVILIDSELSYAFNKEEYDKAIKAGKRPSKGSK